MAAREVSIRRAKEKDISEIVELSYALFQEDAGQRDPFMNLNWPREGGDEHFSRLVSGDHSVCFLAEMDGEIVGYLVGYAMDATSLRPVKLAELESMFVRKEFRSQGVGGALANEFTKWSKQEGAQRISVTAYAANVGAVEFYKRLGFEPRNLSLELGIG